MNFLNNCKQFGVYPKCLIFKLRNVSNIDVLSFYRFINLNAQQNHLVLTFYYSFCPALLFFVFVCLFFSLLFLFRLLFSLCLTPTIDIFFSLNYILLLLHLITNTFYRIFLFHLLFSLSLR